MRFSFEETFGRTKVALELSSNDLTRLLVAAACLNVLALLGTAITPDGIPAGWAGNLSRFAVEQLNLRTERTLVVGYSSFLLLAAAAGFALAFAADRAAGPPGDALGRGWLAIAAGFAALSLDEAGALHEAIGRVEGLNPFEGIPRSWVGVFALPIAAAGCAMGGFAVLRLRQSPGALLAFTVGLLLFLTVPAQEWLEARMRDAAPGAARPMAYALLLLTLAPGLGGRVPASGRAPLPRASG